MYVELHTKSAVFNLPELCPPETPAIQMELKLHWMVVGMNMSMSQSVEIKGILLLTLNIISHLLAFKNHLSQYLIL